MQQELIIICQKCKRPVERYELRKTITDYARCDFIAVFCHGDEDLLCVNLEIPRKGHRYPIFLNGRGGTSEELARMNHTSRSFWLAHGAGNLDH